MVHKTCPPNTYTGAFTVGDMQTVNIKDPQENIAPADIPELAQAVTVIGM